jgi:tripartite motif-containing protein 2/3/tripartite motif-containing protein 71
MEGFRCEFVSEISGTRASCSVERRGQSQYEISYQPTIKGRHQLHIKVQGRHIRGSPFSVAVRSPVEKLGTPILTIGGVERPWEVAINQRGEVIEWRGHRVSVFSPSGEKLRSFGTRGSGPGQMVHPCGVAVDGEGNILVVDSDNHRIQRFTSEGQYSTTVGTKGSGHLQFSYPTGIAFNASNNKVYVGDTSNHRVQVLNSDLTFSSTFGKKGSGKGQFCFPCGIACDSAGNVYVTDENNNRIQVFTTGGKYLRMFGRRGQGRGGTL